MIFTEIRFVFTICMLLCTAWLSAGSIRLVNDSPYELRAVIRGADGSNLGEVVLNPAHSAIWNDAYAQKGNAHQNPSNRVLTPYTVLWYCPEGDSYSVNDIVATGALVSALTGTGTRACKHK